MDSMQPIELQRIEFEVKYCTCEGQNDTICNWKNPAKPEK